MNSLVELHPKAVEYAHFEDVMDWPWPNFTPREFGCRGTGRIVVVPPFMDMLQALRLALDFPFIVTSGYRSPDYNSSISSTGLKGPHTFGEAVDILVSGERARRLAVVGGQIGFTGLGLNQKGPYDKRFIHLDTLPPERHQPRPHIWTY